LSALPGIHAFLRWGGEDVDGRNKSGHDEDGVKRCWCRSPRVHRAARAQQRERMRRIAVLMSIAADDPEGQTRLAAFQQGLQQLGWTNGRSVEIATG
jgi:hypothetical protein